MNKTKLLATAFAAAAMAISSTYATDIPSTADDKADSMEKCKPVNSKGKNIIKEHMADCASVTSSCSGRNEAGDPEAWILVPKGDCEKIKKGRFSGISEEIMEKLDLTEEN
jgi:uncharacterized membrane protein